MAITYNGSSVQAVTYNGSDVKIVERNGTIVWCKPLALDILIGTGIASVAVEVVGTNEPSSTAQSATITSSTQEPIETFYGDEIKFTITTEDGYTSDISSPHYLYLYDDTEIEFTATEEGATPTPNLSDPVISFSWDSVERILTVEITNNNSVAVTAAIDIIDNNDKRVDNLEETIDASTTIYIEIAYSDLDTEASTIHVRTEFDATGYNYSYADGYYSVEDLPAIETSMVYVTTGAALLDPDGNYTVADVSGTRTIGTGAYDISITHKSPESDLTCSWTYTYDSSTGVLTYTLQNPSKGSTQYSATVTYTITL